MTDTLAHLPSPRPSSDPSAARSSEHWLVQLLHAQREDADRVRLAALLTTAPAPA